MATGGGEGKLDEGSQKVCISSCKRNKNEGCNVHHDEYNEQCCMLHMKVANTVNPKSSPHKEKIMNYF